MTPEGGWAIELLPSAEAGPLEILEKYGDAAFDQALDDILVLERGSFT